VVLRLRGKRLNRQPKDDGSDSRSHHGTLGDTFHFHGLLLLILADAARRPFIAIMWAAQWGSYGRTARVTVGISRPRPVKVVLDHPVVKTTAPVAAR
jgi:hypothetical protein